MIESFNNLQRSLHITVQSSTDPCFLVILIPFPPLFRLCQSSFGANIFICVKNFRVLQHFAFSTRDAGSCIFINPWVVGLGCIPRKPVHWVTKWFLPFFSHWIISTIYWHKCKFRSVCLRIVHNIKECSIEYRIKKCAFYLNINKKIMFTMIMRIKENTYRKHPSIDESIQDLKT